MDNNQIKLILVDNYVMFRELLKEYLTDKCFSVLDDVSDSPGLIGRLQELNPDVVLIDLDMPFTNGLEIIRTIKAKMESIKILVITSIGDDDMYKEISPYIDGYIEKMISLKGIEDAIIKVYKGEKHYLFAEGREQQRAIFRHANGFFKGIKESALGLRWKANEKI